jgi:hypothetical protein
MNYIKISKKLMEAFGSKTLEGIVFSDPHFQENQPICLDFEETSLEERKKRGGAEEIIVPEYFPACLVESVLNLQNMGYEVKVVHND